MSDNNRTTLKRHASHLLVELGLISLYHCARDVKLLCLQRFVRLFAYGASALVLVKYLDTLGFSKSRIGFFMTLTLVGDTCISLVLTIFADGVGRKVILVLGAILMAASGILFAVADKYWVLLTAAVLGVISPSGNEIGPFRAIEESTVAHLTDPAVRSDIYAWYSLLGTAGTAFGLITCGWVINHLVFALKWELKDSYRVVFYGYAVLGVFKLILSLALSQAVETEKKSKKKPAENRTETTPLLRDDPDSNKNPWDGTDDGSVLENATSSIAIPSKPLSLGKRLLGLLPEISKQSLGVIITLCILFSMDSFASGLAPLSWVTFYFRSRYNLEEGKLGSVFFVTSIISAASMLVASSLAKRFGNVNTMVFTHLPSAIFLALIPVPNDVHASLVFLILRSCTQSMDVAPRSAFLAAIVLPEERTAIMGLVNVVKTMAQSLGPLITGLLVEGNLFWVAFICAGALKGTYDLGLLFMFKNHEREKADHERLIAAQTVGDEET